jgi:hypothetical protein
MNNRNRLKAGLALAAALAMPVLTNGCGADGDNPLCCNEFKVGGTITASIGGSAESQVAVQAVSDFSGIAAAAIDDITTACRGIATDLDATKAEQDMAEANPDRQARLNAWCSLALSKITAFKAIAKGTAQGGVAATLEVAVVPPKCSASVSAKANCQAKCSGSASCDLKANPPVCKGGKLEVSCKGTCMLEGSATMSCEGKCGATCKGDCTAQGGVAVECQGKCEGTCAAGGMAGGTGVQADGSCKGTCQGTCKADVQAPAVMCSGSCNGECSGSCTAAANASAKCSGKCMGDFEPLKCEGGTLEGGCKAEAKCEGNCDASVSAKAECTPPTVGIVLKVSGGGMAAAEAQIAAFTRLKATLEANLPLVFAFKARLEGMGKLAGTFAANVDAVTDIKAACILPVVGAIGQAVKDVEVSAKASVDLVASVP